MIKKITILVLAIVGVMSYVEGSQFPPANSINNCDLKTVTMQEKKCTKCGAIKPVNEFPPSKRNKIGLRSNCRNCAGEKHKEYRHTKKGLITKIYSCQKLHSERRGHNPPDYTKQELKEWCFSQKLFHELYDNWKANGFQKNDVPSCDRTDDYQGYSLDRLQLMTWKENRDKGHRDIENGVNNKHSKAVVGVNIKTGEVLEFYSTREAARKTGINQGCLSQCCVGNPRYKQVGGYVWKHKV